MGKVLQLRQPCPAGRGRNWSAGGGRQARRHPRPSLLLVVALSIFLLRALAAPIVTFYLAHSDLGFERMGLAQGIVGLVSALVAAVAWILLLAAALGWRREEA